MISGYRLLVTGENKEVLMSMVVVSTLLQRRGGLTNWKTNGGLCKMAKSKGNLMIQE